LSQAGQQPREDAVGNQLNNPSTLVPMDVVDITTSDSADQKPYAFRGFMVTGAGNVAIITPAGTTVTIPGCAAGTIYGIAVARFLAANTTATGIKGLV
jgi:hypothetical protein